MVVDILYSKCSISVSPICILTYPVIFSHFILSTFSNACQQIICHYVVLHCIALVLAIIVVVMKRRFIWGYSSCLIIADAAYWEKICKARQEEGQRQVSVTYCSLMITGMCFLPSNILRQKNCFYCTLFCWIKHTRKCCETLRNLILLTTASFVIHVLREISDSPNPLNFLKNIEILKITPFYDNNLVSCKMGVDIITLLS